MTARLLLGLSGIAAAAAAVPADAQSAPQRTREIIVFGTDPCPRSTDDEVVVCARRPEKERYRLPEAFRPSGPPQLGQSWAVRARSLPGVSATGPGTCSGVGPGGVDGCALKDIGQSRAERAEQDAGDTAPPQ